MSSFPARQHPQVEAIQLNYELCANLHNRIFRIGWLHYDGDKGVPIPAGLYVTGDDRMNQAFENGCQLLLPFTLGSNSWARLCDFEVLGMKPWDNKPEPADVNTEL